MGQVQSSSTSAQAAPLSDMYDVRIVEGGCENPRCLHFVDPSGKAAWASGELNYVSDLPTFEGAQRICRQIMLEPEFVPGTRVQFFKGGRRIKHSTVLKP